MTDVVAKLAALFDQFGPWAVVALFSVSIAVMARHIAGLHRVHRIQLERIHESHRLALASLNEKHHTTATEALRDIGELVKESTTAMVEMRHSVDRGNQH